MLDQPKNKEIRFSFSSLIKKLCLTKPSKGEKVLPIPFFYQTLPHIIEVKVSPFPKAQNSLIQGKKKKKKTFMEAANVP